MQTFRVTFKIAVAGVAIAVAVFLVWYGVGVALMAKPLTSEIRTEIVDIRPKSSSWQTAKFLRAKGLIRQPFHFWLNLQLTGRKLQVGIYYLSPSQTEREISRIISQGKVSEHRLTIPEGWRIEQVAQLLQGRNIVKASSFVEAAAGKEGKLFPDTYQFRVGVSADEIVSKMVANFDKRTQGLRPSKEDIILASIVEREAKHDVDRPKMSGVYKNRLTVGMPLEADPTVQHALDTKRINDATPEGLKDFKFWVAPTAEQNKNFESSYNTYRRKGLPPGPICNPGIKSIKAAMNPEKHDFFFFFNVPDGTTIYSKTREEHDANRAKYGV